MEIIKKEQAEFYSGNGYSGYDYISKDKDINFAVININTRSPETGYQVNTDCKELLYIISDNGILFMQGSEEEFSFKEGDVIVIEKNKCYAFDGNFVAGVACTPAWKSEQHQYVDSVLNDK